MTARTSRREDRADDLFCPSRKRAWPKYVRSGVSASVDSLLTSMRRRCHRPQSFKEAVFAYRRDPLSRDAFRESRDEAVAVRHAHLGSVCAFITSLVR